MKRLTLVLLIVALTAAPAAASTPACPRVHITDEYGRDVSPCRAAVPMSGSQIVALVWAALAVRFD